MAPAMSDGAGAQGAAFAMPRVGMGTAVQVPRPEPIRRAVLKAIEAGYRHFDTAAHYETEAPIGEAAAEAVRSGAIASRGDLFITSKLWCSDAQRDRVLPALRQTLRYAPLPIPDRDSGKEPSDGVRGPVPGPLARVHETRPVQGPLHRRRLRAVRHAGRVGGHGGVPPPGPRQGHRRLQLLLQKALHPSLLRHHPSRRQPGGGEPGVAAEEAEGALQGEGRPDLRLLAAGRQRHALGQRLRHGLRRAARHRRVQGQDRSPGVPEVGVRARGLPDREELRRGADAGEPGHRRLGADGGGEAEDRRHPAAEDQPCPPLRLRPRALQIARRPLGRRNMSTCRRPLLHGRFVFPGADRRACVRAALRNTTTKLQILTIVC